MSMPRILKDLNDLKLFKSNTELDLISIRQNQLVGRYYTPSVSREGDGTSTLQSDPLPTTWTGSGKRYTNGGYVIETTVTPSGANPLSNAFNGNTEDEFIALATPTGTNAVTLTLPEAITVKSFKTYIPDHQGINQVTMQGSTNGTTWDDLYNYNSGRDMSLTVREIPTPGNYRYYRLLFEMDSSDSMQINEWQLNTYTINKYKNKFSLPDIQKFVLSADQRIMIKTPSSYDMTGVSSNVLNGIPIDALLLPSRYYELVYDGSKYLAKEVF